MLSAVIVRFDLNLGLSRRLASRVNCTHQRQDIGTITSPCYSLLAILPLAMVNETCFIVIFVFAWIMCSSSDEVFYFINHSPVWRNADIRSHLFINLLVFA